MKPDAYSLQTKPWANRGPAIYAHRGNVVTPVVYLRRPKHIKPRDFAAFLKRLTLWVQP